MTPAEKLARIKELEGSISHKHMIVCGLLLDGSKQDAAWRAVYPRVKKDSTASAACSRMLKDVKTGAKEYIDLMAWKATASAAEQLGIDKLFILGNLKQTAERCMQAEGVMERGPNGMERSGEYKFEHSGANRANELMGKEIGMFQTKVEHDLSNPLAEIMQSIADSRAGASPLPSGK